MEFDDFFKKTVWHGERPIIMLKCFYCGRIDDVTADHVLPHGYTSRGGDRVFNKGFCVPACVECNSTKGSKLFSSVEDIADHLASVYTKKYKKQLKIPVWNDEELKEMGPVLRDEIKASNWLKLDILERIEHLNVVSMGYFVPVEDRAIPINPDLHKEGQKILSVIADFVERKLELAVVCVKHQIDHRYAGRIRARQVHKDVWLWYERNIVEVV